MANHTRDSASAFGRFFAQESAGGIVLTIAAVLALVVSNSPFGALYQQFLQTPGELRIGGEALVLRSEEHRLNSSHLRLSRMPSSA